MTYDEEVVIDDEVKEALDERLLSWVDVTSGSLFGGVSYSVGGNEFAILLEGRIAARLPEGLKERGLGLAGVSHFLPLSGEPADDWIQFLMLLSEDVPDVIPWLEAAYQHAATLANG